MVKMNRKPIPIYLTEQEREKLEKIRKKFGVKTLSNAVRSMIQFFIYD